MIGHRIRQGGLMRCCLETITEYPWPGEEGKTLQCKYGTTSIIFRDGAWEWNRDKDYEEVKEDDGNSLAVPPRRTRPPRNRKRLR